MKQIKLNLKIFLIALTTLICQLGMASLVWAGNVTLYDFESGVQGWVNQTYTDSQACTSVAQSNVQKYQGTYSLVMNMNLTGGDASRGQGESYIDRGSGNLNLHLVPTNVWVYCPTGSNGNPSLPNGMQIFFKDAAWKSWYGPWNNIAAGSITMGVWTQLSVTPGTTTPAYVDSGFNDTQIREVGVKMAAGGGSVATYTGPIYVDYVNYIDNTPPGAPTGVSVTNPGVGGQLNLSWTNPTDADFSHIHIYRSTASGTLGTLVYDNVVGSTTNDAGLTNGTPYYYTIRSVDMAVPANESTNTAQTSGTPTAPSGAATLYDFEDGTLQTWFLDSAVGLANSTARAKNGTHSVTFTVPTYMDQLGLGGQGYVEARSNTPTYPYQDLTSYTGFSAWIYLGSGMTFVAPGVTASAVIYTAGGGYHRGVSTALYLNASNINTWQKVTFNFAAEGNPVVQSVIGMGVRLEGRGGETGSAPLFIDFVEGVGDVTPPAAPTGISVTNPGTGGQLNLSWTNPGDPDFNHIHVYRSTASGSLGTLIFDNVTGTSVSDTGLTNGTPYYYTVKSVDTSGNISTNTTQYSGTPTLAGGVLYSFEDGTTQGWINDVSTYYLNNLGSPVNSGTLAHAGTKSLSYPLNLTDKDTDGINDVGLIQPATPLNLGGQAGITMYVYLPSNAQIPPDYPLQGQICIKTGTAWTWYNGVTKNINRGNWTKLTIDFSAAEYPAGPVANINDIKMVGVHIIGAAPGQGATTLYVDTVETGLGSDTTPPAAPAGFSATNAGIGNQVNLTWTANGEADFDYYKIYRAHSTGAIGTKKYLAKVNAGTTSYNDTSVINNINYYYQLTAVDKSGNESTGNTERSAMPSGGSGLSFLIEGIQETTWSTSTYVGANSEASLDDLKSTGANYVGVLVTWFMDTKTSNSIAADVAKSPLDSEIISIITNIHSRGMKVMLKPHVDCKNGDWRGYIDPADKAAWFSSYNNFITHFAQIAQANGVELFSIGCELKNMSKVAYLSNWTTVINNIKANYSGPLVYAANSSGNQDEISTACFWSQLDYGGLDIYLPLTDHANPTLDELKKAWTINKDGYNWIQSITDWQAYINKPIIITEIGYQSASGANITPWGVTGPTVNLTEQQNCYEAAFAAWNFKSWMKGWFTWDWNPYQNAGGPNDTNFTPQNKPALDTFISKYGGETVRSFYDFEDGTIQGWTNDITVDFADNLGVPANSVSYARIGTHSLAYPLNLNNKVGGVINDAAYVRPAQTEDFGGYSGIKLYVYIPAGASINAATPLTATVYVKTGNNWDWFESNAPRCVFPGTWREVTISFASAKNKTSQINQVVTNTNLVHEIGVHISGAGTSSGSTTLYVDGTATQGAGDILGIAINPDYSSFGTMPAYGVFASTIPVAIENSGNVNATYSIKCSSSTPTGWGPSATAQALHIFVLNAQFNSTKPAAFNVTNHAVGLTQVMSSGTRFAGNQTGSAVPPAGLRNLWFEFKAPMVNSANDLLEQTIPLMIITEKAP
jgi:fibronectin type 3 domain-containing protein